MKRKMRVHLLIGKKDADIAYWKQSIKSGCATIYIERMLQAELKKKTAVVPVPSQEGLSEVCLDMTVYITDKFVIEKLSSIPIGKRGKYIRRIIRKNLNANYKRIEQHSNEPQEKAEASIVVADEVSTPKPDEKKVENVVSETTERKPSNDFREQIARMNNR